MINSLNEEITRVAYELYEKSNRQEGNDLLNWLAAEKIVHFQKMFPEIGGEAIALLEYKPVYDDQAVRSTSRKTRSRSRKASKDRYPAQVGKGL
ncbi:MAG: DUF2934 domain-containing protein [Syntrophales bacterium]